MRKETCIAIGLLFLGSLMSPSTLHSQSRPVLTRTALSRMDVLSRAELFEQTIVDAARKTGVDPLILWTIAYNETRFRPWLTSPKNAQGLMQFMPATASRFGLRNAYDPTASIDAAAIYVKYLGGLFDGRLDSVLAAYNAGEGTVFAYLNGRKIVSNGRVINPSCRQTPGGVPPYSETINYVSKGMSIYRWLEAQGRLGRTPHVDSVSKIVTPEPKHPKEKPETLEVLYDPRSGSRFLIDIYANTILQPINQAGPVIISPELRGLPAQRARTTFAGIIKPEKK